MAEETTTTPQATETVTEKVTDDKLASEWDKGQETEATETQTEETTEGEQTQEPTEEQTEEQTEEHQETQIPEEPADNAERSRLGRRLKQVEEINRKILDELQSLKGGQTAPVTVPENVTFDDSYVQSRLDEAISKGLIPETIITPSDQMKVNNFINGLQADMSNQYASRYLNTLKSHTLKGTTPDDIHAEVITELQKVDSQFNLNRYNNPTVDAQMNYHEAKSFILQKRLVEGKPTTAFKGKPKDSPATGTSVTTRTATVANDLPELDEASRDFIKRTGMSVDSVKAALKQDLPLHLRGKY
jgi:hypothetical protein